MIIGITGKSGSGKTYISKILESLNGNIISLNIDEIGHLVLKNKEVKTELVKAFGSSILINEEIERKKLGELVFNSRDKMKTLTDVTWEHMKNYIDKFLLENKNKIIVLEWILLPQTQYFGMCDLKIIIDVPYEIRLQRAIKRDGINKDKFDLRENASIDYSQYIFDYTIDNSTIDSTRKKVKKIYEKSIISRKL